MSSLLVDDCKAYRDFLTLPSRLSLARRAERASARCRPFATDTLTLEPPIFAIRIRRAAFAGLVDIRYLAGNPWRL